MSPLAARGARAAHKWAANPIYYVFNMRIGSADSVRILLHTVRKRHQKRASVSRGRAKQRNECNRQRKQRNIDRRVKGNRGKEDGPVRKRKEEKMECTARRVRAAQRGKKQLPVLGEILYIARRRCIFLSSPEETLPSLEGSTSWAGQIGRASCRERVFRAV